jgi:hypothetical protein
MTKKQPSLPSKRAFVVQLHADAQVEQGQWRGRVEHLNSGEAAHFASSEELLAFMARTLAAQQQTEAEISSENDG